MGTLTFGADSVAYDAPSRAPKRVSDHVAGTEGVYDAFLTTFNLVGESRGNVFSKSELVEYSSLLGFDRKCTTCKRKKTYGEVFTYGDKTCDACCLTKRKRRARARKSARVLKRSNVHETIRTCSSCKCARNAGKFANATRKTCSTCLEKRRVKRLKQMKIVNARSS